MVFPAAMEIRLAVDLFKERKGVRVKASVFHDDPRRPM